jgi:hypothetical protein
METDNDPIEDSQHFSVNFNTSDLNEGDVKDDVVKPETVALNLKLYSLLMMSRQDYEYEILMNKIVKKLNLETDPLMRQIYWKNKTLRSCFLASRMNIDINFHAVKYTNDPLELTMNVKDLVILLKNSNLLTDSEDENMLIDIVERFMDHNSTFKNQREEYLVKRPIILELMDGESIDLNSTLNGDDLSMGPDFGSGT